MTALLSPVLRISRAERATSPVFIVGEARSGTTILYRTLQKHEAFRPAKENLWESKVMAYADKTATFGPGEPSSMHGYMAGNDDSYNAFLETLEPLRGLLRLGDRAAERLGHSKMADTIWALTGHTHLVRAYFHYSRQARGVTRVLEKTPQHVRHVDRLLRCYPEARLIYVHRHPVDVYTSYVRRAQVDPKAKRWAAVPIPKFANTWINNTNAALDAARRLPDSFLLLRYEDFTADPESAAKQICVFVDEPYDPEIIIERNPDLTRRKAAPHLFGEITTKTKEWQDFLSQEDANKLQNRVRPIMERLSYEPY